MEITRVNIKKVNSHNPNLLGIATIEIDNCLVIHDLVLIQGKNRRHIRFPSKKMEYRKLNLDNSGYDKSLGYMDIVHPSTKEFREQIENVLFKIYDEEVTNNEVNK